MNAIEQALNEIKPELAARFVRNIQYSFDEMVNKLGPTLKGIANDSQFARCYRMMVAPYVRLDAASKIRTLDVVAVEAAGAVYADNAAAEWLYKINEKLGELTAATVLRLSGAAFIIVGTKGADTIKIKQICILKQSSTGILFNQFPARIYRNGKFISEAAYKKLAA